MSEASGRPLSKAWKPVGSSEPDLETVNKAKVLSQLRFDQIGSLSKKMGPSKLRSVSHVVIFCIADMIWRFHVGHSLAKQNFPTALFLHSRSMWRVCSYHIIAFVAPVSSRDEYESNLQYRSAVDLWNDFVTIGCKIDTSENRLDYIIAANALRDIVRKLELPAINPETFPLCHADLSANNIYVDGR